MAARAKRTSTRLFGSFVFQNVCVFINEFSSCCSEVHVRYTQQYIYYGPAYSRIKDKLRNSASLSHKEQKTLQKILADNFAFVLLTNLSYNNTRTLIKKDYSKILLGRVQKRHEHFAHASRITTRRRGSGGCSVSFLLEPETSWFRPNCRLFHVVSETRFKFLLRRSRLYPVYSILHITNIRARVGFRLSSYGHATSSFLERFPSGRWLPSKKTRRKNFDVDYRDSILHIGIIRLFGCIYSFFSVLESCVAERS